MPTRALHSMVQETALALDISVHVGLNGVTG